MVTGVGKGLAGRQAANTGGGSGRGWTTRRRMTNRVQGGDDGGRSHGGNRRNQGGSDGGRSQDGDRRNQGGSDGGRSQDGDIYIYAFSRRFYSKRLTLHSSFYILSALAFPGNRTHDLGVASAMLYQLSYRKAGDRWEQEEPGGTQIPARMAAHGGTDRGRSHGGGMADGFITVLK